MGRPTSLGNPKDAADVVVTIYGRGFGAEQFGELVQMFPKLNLAIATPLTRKDYWVVATLVAGEYQLHLSGRTSSSMLPWRDCADALVEDIKSWIDVNKDQLLARRLSRTATGHP